MSYLSGPLSRGQIEKLMDPVRERFAPPTETKSNDPPQPPAPAVGSPSPPSTSGEVEARYVETAERVPKDVTLEYRPGLYGVGKLHFVKTTSGYNLDRWDEAHTLKCFNEDVPDGLWEGALVHVTGPITRGDAEYEGVRFADLPGDLANEKKYKHFARELKD